jgi:UDP-N-acetylmuramoyl-tripeptide--D-alanyl-D-alanine ligase
MILLSEIAKAVGGQLLGKDVLCESIGSDSRNIIKNQLFVAIKGENFDGNTFAAAAIQQGAAAALVSDASTQARPVVLVQDTRIALGVLAKYWREKFKIPLIAITGSNGKTTVKEMLVAILNAANKNVLATKGNLNNDIGMPMTLLNLRQQHDVAVIEMGMNHLGEIDYLTRIAQPSVALINNAGTAHIGELGSRENIAKAKGEIFAGLTDDGIAVINADDTFADYWRNLNKNRTILSFGIDKKADITAALGGNIHEPSSHVILKAQLGEIALELHMLGAHNVRNALAAATAALALNVPLSAIAQGLSQFGGVKGRLQRKHGLGGALLIDDTYNANPDSMKAALDVLATQAGSKIFVMGDMGELGADAAKMHAEIGAYAKQKSVDKLLALGENSVHAVQAFGVNATHYASLEANIHAASGLMQKGVNVLVKGSRFMQMERVVAALEDINKSDKNALEKDISKKAVIKKLVGEN